MRKNISASSRTLLWIESSSTMRYPWCMPSSPPWRHFIETDCWSSPTTETVSQVRNICELRGMHEKAEYLTKDCIIKVDDVTLHVPSQQDSSVHSRHSEGCLWLSYWQQWPLLQAPVRRCHQFRECGLKTPIHAPKLFFGVIWPPKWGAMWKVLSPKRHILARVRVVWAIMRENPSTCLTCRWVPKKGYK